MTIQKYETIINLLTDGEGLNILTTSGIYFIRSYEYYYEVQDKSGKTIRPDIYLESAQDIIQEVGKILRFVPDGFKSYWKTHIKALVPLISMHKRAVISANHPERKMVRGEFNI
jgi:hypothetical protein